jgi:hypothetical protein
MKRLAGEYCPAGLNPVLRDEHGRLDPLRHGRMPESVGKGMIINVLQAMVADL